jgi:uncharacterized protein (TIGR02231 family)
VTEALATPAAAGETRALPSEITLVTLFEDRALVVRRAKVRLEPGSAWVALTDITPYLDDRSVQACTLEGAHARVLAARVVRHVHEVARAGREQIDAAELAERQARRHVGEADALLASAVTQQAHAQALHGQWLQALSATPRGLRQPESRALWGAARDKLADRLARANALADRARRERRRATEGHVRAVARLDDARTTFVRHEARIEVHLETDAAEPGAAITAPFEVRYHTAAALWRPEHAAKLVIGADRAATLELVTWATSWQRTGEAWDDVHLGFSTARPAQHATAPLLEEDLVSVRRKTEEEKRQVVVQAREQTIAVAGLGRGVRAVEEMPGVDDGGVPQLYLAKDSASLPSDGRPTRIEIARITLRAEVSLVVWPEQATVAHLRATATLAEGGPILAGPVHVSRGAGDGRAIALGTSRLDYVGKGDPFELSFGVDDTVRARRKVKDEADTTAVLGTQRRRRTVTVWLSNLANDTKRVRVIERIPVSEIEGLDVTLVEGRGWRHDAKDGILQQDMDLGPLETKSASFSFELRASSKVVLPVL